MSQMLKSKPQKSVDRNWKIRRTVWNPQMKPTDVNHDKEKQVFLKKVFKGGFFKEKKTNNEESFFKNLVCNEDRIHLVQIPPKFD